MSARSVRRSFSSPFVVTLAAAVPAAACYVQPAPARSGGGGAQTGEQVPANPPPDHSTTTAGAEQTAPADTTIVANPPRPAPVPVAKQDRRWTVTRAAGKCSAFVATACPTPPPGQPAPTCNPPPPTPYTCLPSMADGTKVTIVQFAGQGGCQVEPEPMSCPPNVMCNPPPPQKAACPQ